MQKRIYYLSYNPNEVMKTKRNTRSEKMIGNKNHLQYLNTLDAVKYLVKNSVYANEWSGVGMYEAIVKILPSKKVKISFLNQLLKEASEM